MAGTKAGAEFSFALGGLLLCGEPTTAYVSWLGCAGFEIGELSGVGLVSNPHSDGSGWAALRAEVGAGIPFSGGVAATVRLGAAVPLVRGPFVLDESERLHKPDSLTARALVGLEVQFR